jgi:alpha-beta hydrolase superfamily lysophospholipase
VGRRVVLVLLVASAFHAGAGAAATPQQVAIAASDGVQLACTLAEPDGAPPAGGWPAVMLFHGLGETRAAMQAVADAYLVPAGYASLACDARGTGGSGGLFGLDGPRDVQDTRELFAWLAARPEVSDSQIGALGRSLGGGAVWNATAAGVPFRAIVPIETWTSLIGSLAPQGLSKSGLVAQLASLVPAARWEPDLLAAEASLVRSTNTTQASALAAARSPLPHLRSIAVPTLLIQGRHDFLFDADQAEAAYEALAGPKRLYVGDLGHPPAANPAAEAPYYYGLAVKWFDRFLKGTPNGIDRAPAVELAHDPWDGKTSRYAMLPPTKTVTVSLPGAVTIETGGKVVRGARITGGPHETYGRSAVTVRYSGATGWDRFVAVLGVAGDPTPITAGGVEIAAASGVATIHLMNEAVRIPSGARLVVTLGATSTVQGGGTVLYLEDVPPGSSIEIERETLALSVLRKAVSRWAER